MIDDDVMYDVSSISRAEDTNCGIIMKSCRILTINYRTNLFQCPHLVHKIVNIRLVGEKVPVEDLQGKGGLDVVLVQILVLAHRAELPSF